MAFDGNFVWFVAKEMKEAVDSHIDKIYQPSSDEIILVLRKKGFVKRLLLSAKSGMSRVHFTEMKLENPEKPPMFCMLMRKFFSGARLTGVMQKDFERLLEFSFETSNEMGDRVIRCVIAELIGNSSNIILLDENKKIIDALKRSDITSDKRLIQPGAFYTYPAAQDKADIKNADIDTVLSRIIAEKDIPLSKALISSVGGVSPLVVREMLFRSGTEDVPVGEISDFSALITTLSDYKSSFHKQPTPFMLTDNGKPVDFSYMEIRQYGDMYKTQVFENCSELLDAFYRERARSNEQSRITGEIAKLVLNLIARAEKRLNNRKIELESCKNREELRIKGELIKANISAISAGDTSVTVKNFYDEDLSDIVIELDPSLNAQNNAAKYFKEYKKKSIAAGTLADLIEADIVEKEYLETVLESLSRCRTKQDLAEIKSELIMAGYIRDNKNQKQKKSSPAFNEYESMEGFKILVGKNNLQNDYITTKMASKNDLWFHTKNIHGSHVVVFCGGEEVSNETIIFAAKLAAKNSKAANSSNVPVDYTRIKYVKKPSGAKPGMVIYTDNKTVFVTP